MKTVPLTIRRCPPELHQSLKRSAEKNRRSLNSEALVWLEREAEQEEPLGCADLAKNLRRARKLMSEREHREFAKDIEAGVKLMRREHLH